MTVAESTSYLIPELLASESVRIFRDACKYDIVGEGLVAQDGDKARYKRTYVDLKSFRRTIYLYQAETMEMPLCDFLDRYLKDEIRYLYRKVEEGLLGTGMEHMFSSIQGVPVFVTRPSSFANFPGTSSAVAEHKGLNLRCSTHYNARDLRVHIDFEVLAGLYRKPTYAEMQKEEFQD